MINPNETIKGYRAVKPVAGCGCAGCDLQGKPVLCEKAHCYPYERQDGEYVVFEVEVEP